MPGITVLYTLQPTKPRPQSITPRPSNPFFHLHLRDKILLSQRQNTHLLPSCFLLSASHYYSLLQTCMAFCNTRSTATSSPSGEGWVTNDIFSSFRRSGLILLGATSFDSPLSLFCGALSVSAHGCGVVGFSLGGAGRRLYGLCKWVWGLSGGVGGVRKRGKEWNGVAWCGMVTRD
jgi:hypothetical protein